MQRLKFKIIHSISLLIAFLPLRLYPALSWLLMVLAWPFLGKERQKLRRNVARVYQLPGHSSFARQFEGQVFRHQLISLMETLRVVLNPSEKIEFQNFAALQKHLNKCRKQGQGCIFITGHMGSWELMARTVSLATEEPFHALAKPSKSSTFSLFLTYFRAKMNTKVLWTDRKDLLREMMRILREGSNLGFVMDQKPEGRVGPIVDFMGLKTEFVSGPAKLAKKLKVPVIATFCMRDGPLRYRVCFETVYDGQEDLDELEITQRMALAIERTIRLYPEQWVWNYKRWRFANS